ncbi:MAG: hypothetical protein MAG451_01454 [Anaerolineales bacterium]|nr:hypothetical protein [Anaerolineales bacterium]
MPTPLNGWSRNATNPAESPSVIDREVKWSGGKEFRVMRATRIVFATFVALMGLMLLLQQQAAADSGLAAQPAGGAHRVYLGMIAVDAGLTNRASTSAPQSAISVAARAVLSCDNDGDTTIPVGGARIMVITDHSSRTAFTDASGEALFSAAPEPAVIQIEWPVGLLPCPNSRPSTELPNGAGEVEFMALAQN